MWESAMTRPFEGIRVIDVTHVLAGPFAAYQLAVLGADVIKVEHPDDLDQSRSSGTTRRSTAATWAPHS
jgi:crotonobetainyl-CoA:carnitine CoA-transferase CaiB-like acyl-CoA transferase